MIEKNYKSTLQIVYIFKIRMEKKIRCHSTIKFKYHDFHIFFKIV